MSYPSQINEKQILEQARILIESDGAANVSLYQLAQSLRVKTPSLYRYIQNKTDLLRKVNLNTLERLFAAMEPGLQAAPEKPAEQLLALFMTFRAFAHANPQTYALIFSNLQEELRPNEDLLVQMVLPLQELVTAVSGPENALTALRGALALVHGFVMLELNNQLRRGGDLNQAFIDSVIAYFRGWQLQEKSNE